MCVLGCNVLVFLYIYIYTNLRVLCLCLYHRHVNNNASLYIPCIIIGFMRVEANCGSRTCHPTCAVCLSVCTDTGIYIYVPCTHTYIHMCVPIWVTHVSGGAPLPVHSPHDDMDSVTLCLFLLQLRPGFL